MPNLNFAKSQLEKLKNLLESPEGRNFIGLDDKAHSFTNNEVDLILERAKLYFERVENTVVEALVEKLLVAKTELEAKIDRVLGIVS